VCGRERPKLLGSVGERRGEGGGGRVNPWLHAGRAAGTVLYCCCSIQYCAVLLLRMYHNHPHELVGVVLLLYTFLLFCFELFCFALFCFVLFRASALDNCELQEYATASLPTWPSCWRRTLPR